MVYAKGGTTVKSDLLQAEGQVSRHREEVFRAEQAVQAGKIAVRHAIGVDDPVDASENLRAKRG